jgi:hypothetical protein
MTIEKSPPMSPKERMRSMRKRQLWQGKIQVTLALQMASISRLDSHCTSEGLTRAQVIEKLISGL